MTDVPVSDQPVSDQPVSDRSIPDRPVGGRAASGPRLLMAGAASLALAACASPEPAAVGGAAPAARPAPAAAPAPVPADGRRGDDGLVIYRDYAAVVAREGDTVEAMAARVGLPASELAAYNGLPVSYRPQRGDELVLPPRPGGYAPQAPQAAAPVAPTAPQPLSQPLETIAAAPPEAAPVGAAAPVDGGWSAARVNEAIERGTATPAAGAPGSTEVLYHNVAADETIYSISRLYGVAPETLIAWNALAGPAYAVRPGQVLTVPAGFAPPPSTPLTAPGAGGVAAPPPSAGAPLPADTVPPAPLALPRLDQFQSPVAPPPPAAAAPAPVAAAPAPAPARTAAAAPDRLLRPVPGPVLRPWNRDNGPARNDGVDFSAQAGEPVTAAADGVVALISTSLGEWGTIVLVRHDERLMTVYGRMGDVAVERGEAVRAGQRLGSVAPSDDGPAFLHFEVRRGAFSEDPMTFF